jgi:alpha-glucosidase
MLNFSRALLRWRRGQPLLRTGKMRFLDAPESVLWLERRQGNSALQAVFNLSAESVSLVLPQALAPAKGAPAADAQIDGDTLALPPFGVFFGEPLHAA